MARSKPELGASCFCRLLTFAGWPHRMPFCRTENPPIAFICELKKQVHNGLVLLGEGQSAISDRADAAHGRGFTHVARALLRRIQTALKPAAKSFGMHRIFIRGKCRKQVIAGNAFERMKVDARAYWLNTGEPH
jgi:hypothetical protein